MRSLPVFILTRLLSVLVVMVAVAAVTFVMLHVLRPEAFPDPRPLPVELADHLRRVFLHYDFGVSWDRQGRPVADMLTEGLPADVALLAGALVLGCVLGMIGGVLCAARPGATVTRAVEGLATLLLVAPVYWVGLMVILLFNSEFGALARVPGFDLNAYQPLSQDPAAWLRALIIPWLVLAAPLAAMCVRMTRAAMIEVLDEDFLLTATAKGLPRRTVLRRHALPVASSPVLTLVGVNMTTLVVNVVLVERAFSIPGVFRHTTQAMNDGNFPLLQGMTVVAAALVVVSNLVVDVVQAMVDPRVRGQSMLAP